MNIKKIISLLILSIFFFQFAWAHPPSRIEIDYNKETGLLQAKITHPVSEPAKHFIDKVHISLNGEEVIEIELSQQDNKINQTIVETVSDVKAGDIVSVEAYCSISGKLTKKIEVK